MRKGERIVAAALLLLALVLAWLFNAGSTTGVQAKPGFDALVAFYVVTQAIERVIEVIFWVWEIVDPDLKADERKVLGLALGTLLGVIVSSAFGLYFLGAVTTFDDAGGGGGNRILDVLVTGLVIAGGSKPLHDLVSVIEKRSTTSGPTLRA